MLLAWLGQASPAAASFSGHARSVLYLYEADPPDSMEIRALGLQYLRADFRPALSNLSLHTYGSVRGDWSDEPFRHGRLYFGCIEWSSRASSRAGVGFCGYCHGAGD